MTGINWIKPATTKLVEAVTALNDGTGAIEWSVSRVHVSELTAEELKALQHKHGSKSVNIARATDVKRWMREGLTLSQMAFQSKRRKGYGPRMLAKDRAALAPLLLK